MAVSPSELTRSEKALAGISLGLFAITLATVIFAPDIAVKPLLIFSEGMVTLLSTLALAATLMFHSHSPK